MGGRGESAHRGTCVKDHAGARLDQSGCRSPQRHQLPHYFAYIPGRNQYLIGESGQVVRGAQHLSRYSGAAPAPEDMMRGVIDVETYSEVDLNRAGALRYAVDPTTECLCVAIQYDDDTVRIWKPGDDPLPIPDVLAAWNAEFDRAIYNHILVRRHGWPKVPHQRWDCIMVR